MNTTNPIHTRSPKSRNLSIYDYFKILQVEWLIADLRERIYVKQKDKDHWKLVKEGKRQKIQNIAEKNTLPTIFDDADLAETIKKTIYREQGFPAFQYKNDNQRASQEYYDMLNYFLKGVDIRAQVNGEIIVCKIHKYKPYETTLLARNLDTGEIVKLEVKSCSRIM